MPRSLTRPLTAGALVLALGAPALAIGLGPLSHDGITDGPAKGFYLTAINPYDEPRNFRAFAAPMYGGMNDDIAAIDIRPAQFRLAAGKQRRVLVVVQDLAPGETRKFRVCAELAQQEGMINARVCSKLAARRVAR